MAHFPFHSLDDDEFNLFLDDNSTFNFLNQHNVNHFDYMFDKYDHCEINSFLDRISIPNSEYITVPDNFVEYIDPTFNIVTMNIASIASNLQSFIDQILSISNVSFDIIGFSETRLDEDISPLYNITNYTMHCVHRNRHGGGVAVYIHDAYTSLLLPNISQCESYLECVCVEIMCSNRKCFIATIYRPPNGSFPEFINQLTNILEYVSSKNYHTIYFMGDWNINLLHQSEPHVRDFINLMFSYFLLPITTKPTRVSDNSFSLIDHIWSSKAELNVGNYIIHTDISDHFPVISRFQEGSTRTQQDGYVYKRVLSKGNIAKFVECVAQVNWVDVMHSNCPNDAFNLFHEKFSETFRNSFPLKCIKQNKSTSITPYLTPGLMKSIKEKHRLARLAKKWPVSYRETYKRYRNNLTTLLRNAKNEYYKSQLRLHQGNAKESWKTINEILGREAKGNYSIDLNITPQSETANVFNNHFINVVDTANANSSDESTDFRNFLNMPTDFSMYLFPCNELEIKELITTIKSNSPGYDEINGVLLKETADYIVIPLSHIINLCFRHGVFPDRLKIAKALPLHKSGSKSEVNNFRLISILPSFSKVFEKAIAHRLLQFLENNKLLSTYQFGFRKNSSTQSALLHFVSKVYSDLDKKLHVASAFLDISKAFDSLNHQILLTKLNNLGLRGPVLNIFKSYLTKRKQFVYCNNVCSNYKLIKHGVPQGSILGPILFLIYINDITNSCDNVHFTMYADDTCFTMADKDLHVLHSRLTRELFNVSRWMKANMLKLNVDKTHIMLFQNRSLVHDLNPVILDQQVVLRVKSTKFLGVCVDDNLNWKNHISNLTTILYRNAGLLYRIRHKLSGEALLTLYYTLCYSKIMYCISIWGCTWRSFLDNVFRAQKRILRVITFKKRFDSTDVIFSDLKLLKVNYIHKYFLLLEIFRSLGKNDGIFNFQEHTHSTRRNYLNLICPQFRTQLFNNSILCFGPKVWNSLPAAIKNLNTPMNINSFKYKAKKHLLDLQL